MRKIGRDHIGLGLFLSFRDSLGVAVQFFRVLQVRFRLSNPVGFDEQVGAGAVGCGCLAQELSSASAWSN
jgi:hypothetical protein